MLYLIKIDDSINFRGNTQYILFETNTESVISGSREFVVELVNKYKMEAKNFSVKRGLIELNKWPHNIKYTSQIAANDLPQYVLLVNQSEKNFKLVTCTGYVYHFEPKELKKITRESKIANCEFKEDTQEYKSVDTYTVKEDPKFEKYINSKYSEFRMKVLTLGLDISFAYTVEGRDVKLTSYNGTSERVILPNFITTIKKKAFFCRDITELKLNEGLKFIGNEAVSGNKISYVEIPKSVEFIGQKAFFGNRELINTEHKVDHNKFKVLGNKTAVLDEMH